MRLPNKKQCLLLLGALLLGFLIWLPCLHLFFKPDINAYLCGTQKGIPVMTGKIASRHLRLWENPDEKNADIQKMRAINGEWDFMGRTFLVLSLANMALRETEKSEYYIKIIDRIIADTLRVEREKGMYYFLLPYARARDFITKPPRSIFIDGEIALMLASRRLLKEDIQYKKMMTARIIQMLKQMRESPILAAESYPDECWLFCNSIAVAAVKIGEVLDANGNEKFIEDWLKSIKAHLVDQKTGLLCSAYGVNGSIREGPEGSSIWLVAHCLQLIDKPFAQDQYKRAKKELACSVLGFGYAKEWPASYVGPEDVDSGPIVPLIGASAGSSGLAFLGAGAFNDREYFQELLTSLNYGGFPAEKDGCLIYQASNQVGDSVLLYSMVVGPLWKRVEELSRKKEVRP
jgi:hypothetical protein